MARQAVGDGQDVFRVVLVERAMKRNPDHHWDQYHRDVPYYIPDPDSPPYVTTYGPYNSLGTARGQLSYQVGKYARNVISATVQKASTTWEDVAP